MFGRDAYETLNAEFDTKIQSLKIYDWQKSIDTARIIAMTKDGIARNKPKIKYDQRVSKVVLKEEDLVLIRLNQRNNKLSERNIGPFRILEIDEFGNCLLLNVKDGNQILRRHRNDLVKFHSNSNTQKVNISTPVQIINTQIPKIITNPNPKSITTSTKIDISNLERKSEKITGQISINNILGHVRNRGKLILFVTSDDRRFNNKILQIRLGQILDKDKNIVKGYILRNKIDLEDKSEFNSLDLK